MTGLPGMQKSHRKLHLSVTETLSLLASRPNESASLPGGTALRLSGICE